VEPLHKQVHCLSTGLGCRRFHPKACGLLKGMWGRVHIKWGGLILLSCLKVPFLLCSAPPVTFYVYGAPWHPAAWITPVGMAVAVAKKTSRPRSFGLGSSYNPTPPPCARCF